MDDPSTDCLRKLAPTWTLAGDEKLLSILQDTHQRLLSKCQEANCQLEQMATVLNDASISLQNVNNQFMALSSSQFIESRVYDDDDVTTDIPATKEPPIPEIPDELSSLKRSISVLENAHEIITILHDSDTESDTDDEMPARMVLKPKDMYADRPLPYIIGSQPWKNKWHAGLLLEDSDTDSTASKPDHDSEQYSQSEPEDTHTDKLRVPDIHDTTVSETSSELPSEQGSVPKLTPSDVAGEIARRLGAGGPPKMVEREPEYDEPAKPTVRKIYRPQDPVPTTVFPDEPPPLSDSDSPEPDIFAELRREQPYAQAQVRGYLPGFDDHSEDEGDIFSDFANKPVTDPSAKPTSLFDAGPAPHMFDKHPQEDRRPNIHDSSAEEQRVDDNHHTADRNKNIYDKPHVTADGARLRSDDRREQRRSTDPEVDRSVKKPVGGISLFGSKGTESIGAAILKRNQRKSISSGDESESDSRSESQSDQQIRKEKDIFDDLFARSEGKKVTKDKIDVIKNIKTDIQRKNEEKLKDNKVESAKVDLFSDNLFDDIDDIFTTNVVKMPSKDKTQSNSIFEDDDDLFSEIAAPKPMKIEVASSSNNKKSLFDTDDELFAENLPKSKPDVKPKIIEKATKVNESAKITESVTKISEPPKINNRSIFDDDEDDIFSDVKTNKLNETTKVQNNPVSEEKYNESSKGDEQTSKIEPPKSSSSVFETPSLFCDDDENDLFAKSSNTQNDTIVHNKDIKERSSKTEVNIPEKTLDKNVKVIPSSSAKSNDFEQTRVKNENVNLNKENSQTIENNVNKIVESRTTEKDSSTLTVSENLDRKVSNIETTAAKITDHIKIGNIEQSSSDTNNDFSDQDFDDLPQKEETNNKIVNINSNTVTEIKNKELPTDIHNIFDRNTFEDNIFEKSEQNTDNSESIFRNSEPDFTETIAIDFKKTEQDNKTNQNPTENKEADIFSDILTEPPEFEKPKEPKKSKNVNALFDDDSDDESLFFKKNDPIFEENPEEIPPTQERLFGIFADEPPDDGFSKISDDLDDAMFGSLPKPKLPQNDNLLPIPDTVVFENVTLPKADVKIPEIEKIDPVEYIFSTLHENQGKPEVESPKISVLDTLKDYCEDMSKLPTTTLNFEPNEQEKSPSIYSHDEQLFNKIPEQESKLSFKDVISDDENLFQPVHKSEKLSSILLQKEVPVPDTKNQESVNKTSDDELFSSLAITKKPSLDESKIVKQDKSSKSDEELFKIPKDKPEIVPGSKNNEKSSKISPTMQSEPRKVGKLKVGLNINVNALLPGASPKKVKINDQTDGQAQSLAGNEEPESKIYTESQKPEPIILKSENTDSKLLKSLSFDGKPESDVLDNKLSKERAKIQVKRRPSTRRARKEAVRKSGIDFGEDSTDNSSSIDDPPRLPTRKKTEFIKKTNTEEQNSEDIDQDVERHNIVPERKDESKIKTKAEATTIQAEVQTRLVEREPINQLVNVQTQAEVTEKPNYTKDVKSKVVYILNDEDIFNTSPVEKPDSMKKDLTKDSSFKTENADLNTGVTTLGKVYDKSNTKSDTNTKEVVKKTLFEDDDEEIFKGKTAVKKTTIFDSDSEEELFGTSKKEEKREVKKEIKREVVKRSLFGDEDDDDDLFGVKTKKSVEKKPQPSRTTARETPKPTQPVFEDPLSMFSDDV